MARAHHNCEESQTSTDGACGCKRQYCTACTYLPIVRAEQEAPRVCWIGSAVRQSGTVHKAGTRARGRCSACSARTTRLETASHQLVTSARTAPQGRQSTSSLTTRAGHRLDRESFSLQHSICAQHIKQRATAEKTLLLHFNTSCCELTTASFKPDSFLA
eukprot:6185105-Pleurochrysis_carterae.AAC.4